MTSFDGTLRIEGEGGPPVPVRARVGGDLLTLEIEGVAVGEWPVSGLSAQMDRGGVMLRLGDESVTIDVTDRIGFVSALLPPDPDAKGKIEKRPGKDRRPTARRRPSLAVSAMIVGLLGAVTAAVLVTELVGSLILLLGLFALVIGAVAHSEPRVALRLPLNLQPGHVVVAGLIFLGLGVLLVALG